MEVKLSNRLDFPEGSVLSIRYGAVRRQAPISALLSGASLKFPQKRDGSEHMRIDVLQPVCKPHTAMLAHNQEEVNFELLDRSSGLQQTECRLTVRNDDKLASPRHVQDMKNSEAAQVNNEKYQEAAKHARVYLEDHKLLQYFQQLLHTCLQEKPKDPMLYIWQKVGSSLNGDSRGQSWCEDSLKEHQRQLQAAEEERAELEKQLASLTERVEHLDKIQLNQAASAGSAADSREIESLRSQVEEYKRKIEDNAETWKAQLKQIEEAEQMRGELEGLVQMLTDRVKALAEAREDRGREDAAGDAPADKDLVQKLNDSESRRAALEQRVTDLKKRLQTAQEGDGTPAAPDAATMQAIERFEESERKRKEMEKRVADLSEKLQKQQAGDGRIAASEGATTEQIEKFEESERRREDLEKRVAALNTRLQNQQAEEGRIAASEGATTEQIQKFKESESRREDLEKRVGELSSRLQGLQDGEGKTASHDPAVLERVESAKGELEEAENKRRALEQRVAQLMSRVDAKEGVVSGSKAMPLSVVENSTAENSKAMTFSGIRGASPQALSQTEERIPSGPKTTTPKGKEGEAALRDSTRQILERSSESGLLQAAFDKVAVKKENENNLPSKTNKSNVEATKLILKEKLEDSLTNGNLLAATTAASAKTMREGVDIAAEKLQSELAKGIPKKEDLAKGCQKLAQHFKNTSDADIAEKLQDVSKVSKEQLRQKFEEGQKDGTLAKLLDEIDYGVSRGGPSKKEG